MTVPYLRIPLVLQFFAMQEHTPALGEPELQNVIDCCLFEPGVWREPGDVRCPEMIPAADKTCLRTPLGLLFNELQKSPYNIVKALDTMLENALELDTGRYAEPSGPVILYMI